MRHPAASLAVLFALFAAAPGVPASEAPPPHAPTTQPAPATQPAPRVRPAEDGSVLLHAKDVTVHGTTVRYEPQPNKNTVGYWTKKDDWVSWEFETAGAGTYHVVILQGCGKGSGGAEVEFSVADATGEGGRDGRALKTTVRDTGGFQNFVSRDIGTIELPAGAHTLSVRPLTKPGVAVMDLRSVTLKPAAEKQDPGAKPGKADATDGR